MLFAVLLKSAPLPSAKLTAVLAALVAFVQQYIFNDWDFIVFLAVFVVLDTLTGIIAAYKNNRLNSKKMWPLVTKVLGYGALLVMTHGLTKFRIHGVQNIAFRLIDILTYTFIMGREALSIIENLTMIDPALVPRMLRKRLEQAVNPEDLINQVSEAVRTAAAVQGTGAAPCAEPETTEPAPVAAAGNP